MSQHRIEGTRLITRRSARDQILLAWDYRCAYCGDDLGGRPTIDHVVPKAKGGPTVPSNLSDAREVDFTGPSPSRINARIAVGAV